MVKLLTKPTYQPPKRMRWWRGILGALITCFIVVPYIMGADAEKYIRGWIDAVNQRHGKIQLELVSYARHWLTSEGDLALTGSPFQEKVIVHFKVYHGPLFITEKYKPRLGLAFLKGTVDSNALLGTQNKIKIAGPIQLSASVPYYSDRDIRTRVPSVTITDKENNLIYIFNALEGNVDGDGLLQLNIPSLRITRLSDGTDFITLDTSLFRILPDTQLASFSTKQVRIHPKKNQTIVFNNLVAQGNALQNKSSLTENVQLSLNLHFDQVTGLTTEIKPLDNVGPFELKLGISGLNSEGLNIIVSAFKTLGTPGSDLTPEQGEQLIKAFSTLFSAHTLFELTSHLNTLNGTLSAQFQGGLNPKPIHNQVSESWDLMDSFYSKGTLILSNELIHALAEYTSHPQQINESTMALPIMLAFFKQNAQDYSLRVDIEHGRIHLNGVDVQDQTIPLTQSIPRQTPKNSRIIPSLKII